jgi:DNA-3-methyladenine glycosylase II
MDSSVAVSGPLDVARTLSRFATWGEDPANQLSGGVFRRAVKVDGAWRGYEITWDGAPHEARIRVSVPGARAARAIDAAIADARHVCGLDLDLASFYRRAASESVMGALVRQLYGLRPTLSPSPFEMLVGSVCAQQVNLTFAFTVRARLIRRFGAPVRVGGSTVFAFPEPRVLARAQVAELRAMQFTVRKAEYIVGLAEQIASGALDLPALARQSNDAIIGALTAVRGLGRWTAEWFLARGLGRGDVCPAGDLAVRKAFVHFYNRGREMSEEAIRRKAATWGAHQNFAVHYLLAGQRLAGKSSGGAA